MTRRASSAIAGGALFLIAALATTGLGAGCRRGKDGERGPTTTAAATGSETELGPFRLGEQVQSHARMTVRLDLGGRGKPQELQIAGAWSATPADIHDGVAEVECALSSVTVRIVAEDDKAASPSVAAERQRAEHELATALANHFFISYRADGAAVGLWFSRGVNPALGNLLMTLVGAQQLVRGPNGEPAWVVQERDLNGQYTVAYRQSAPGRFDKKKARYLETNQLANAVPSVASGAGGGARRAPRIHIERSDFELHADPRGRLLEVRGDETLVIDLGSPGLGMKTLVSIALTDGKITAAPELIGAFARQRPGLEAHPLEQMGIDGTAEIARRDRALLAGATFDDLAKTLAALPADAPPTSAEAGALIRRFEALFRLEASAASRASAFVRASAPPRGKLVIDALSLARTPAAQVALGMVAKDAAAPKLARSYAVQYLAQQDSAPEEAVNAIASMLDDPDPDLRQMARLSYGAFARILRASAPVRGQKITEALLVRLDKTTDAAERIELVVALGNTGDAGALPRLKRMVEEGTLRERTQAIEAMRFIDDPRVDPLLTALLSGDREESIRLAALAAVRFRNVGPFAATLAEMVRKDPAPSVRNAAVSLLGDRLPTLPTLRPVLEEVQTKDTVAKNRELAARYLAR